MTKRGVIAYRLARYIFSGVVFSSAWALDGPPVALDVKAEEDAATRSWYQVIRPAFLRVADEDIRGIIDGIKLRVIRESEFNAFAVVKRREILIPVGTVVLINEIALETGVIIAHPRCQAAGVSFTEKLIDTQRKWQNGETVRLFSSFSTYCGVSAAERVREDRTMMDSATGIVIINSLATIIGHEIGHFAFKQSHDASTMKGGINLDWQEEYFADEFGFNLAKKAKFSPYVTLSTVWPALWELEGPSGANGISDHPPAACRSVRLGQQMLEDREIPWGANPYLDRTQLELLVRISQDECNAGQRPN